MLPLPDQPRFRYPVYAPAHTVMDVVDDWARGIMQSTDDLELTLAQPFRVAALPVFYDRPNTWSYCAPVQDLDLNQFDLVLFSDPEYASVPEIRSWITVPHHVLAVGGITADQPLNSQREVYRPWFIRNFLDQNQDQCTMAAQKPYWFDALLGARRPHRDFVWKGLYRSGLLDHSIVTYRSGFPGSITDFVTDIVSDRLGEFMQWPYVSPNLRSEWEVADPVTHRDSRRSPIEIYRRTWYTITCETQFTGPDFFLSEKTVKAMFNRRVFVLFGPAGYLAQLREHGFETFRHSLDESYDQETRDSMRWEAALHQLWRLAWLEDPVRIYHANQDILQHNHQRLHDLESKHGRDLLDMLLQHIPGQHWHWPAVQIA
jgi:hypothetical protein